MKPTKAWVWETADAKKFLDQQDAVQYSNKQMLNIDSIRKARAQIWETEDGKQFFDYTKAFDHESELIGI